MSIVTLKRKTNSLYNNNSVGFKNFSLNGTRRSQGYIGQESRGRYQAKTILKGNTPKGHGGCCGQYPKKTIVNSIPNANCPNNPDTIKPSVKNTYGLIETKYAYIKRPEPYGTTKPDDSGNQQNHTQSDYIKNLTQKTLTATNTIDCQRFKYTPTKCPSIFRTNRNSEIRQQCANITKDLTNKIAVPTHGVALEYGQYIQNLDKKCGAFTDMKYPRKTQGTPLPSK
jgi:hypothetical protein